MHGRRLISTKKLHKLCSGKKVLRIYFPSSIAKELNLQHGDELVWVYDSNCMEGVILVTKPENLQKALKLLEQQGNSLLLNYSPPAQRQDTP